MKITNPSRLLLSSGIKMALFSVVTLLLSQSCSDLKSSLGFSSHQEASVVDSANSPQEISLSLGFNDQLNNLALGLASSNLILSSYSLSVAGCDGTTHAYYNRSYTDQAFSSTSDTMSFALPSDDAGCYIKLTQLKIAATGSEENVYDLADGESVESASNRTSSGKLVYARSSGSLGPTKISVSVGISSWSNSAAPASGATLTYTLFQVIKSDFVIGQVQNVVGFDPPSMPAEIYLIDNVSLPSASGDPLDYTDGSFRIKLLCTNDADTSGSCDDIVAGSSKNFSVCTLPASGAGAVTEANIDANGLDYCNNSSASAAGTALAQRTNTLFDQIYSPVYSGYILNVSGISLNATPGSLDSMGTAQAAIWVLLYVDAGGSKQGIKYWKVTL